MTNARASAKATFAHLSEVLAHMAEDGDSPTRCAVNLTDGTDRPDVIAHGADAEDTPGDCGINVHLGQ
jgi:hypothetical protein